MKTVAMSTAIIQPSVSEDTSSMFPQLMKVNLNSESLRAAKRRGSAHPGVRLPTSSCCGSRVLLQSGDRKKKKMGRVANADTGLDRSCPGAQHRRDDRGAGIEQPVASPRSKNSRANVCQVRALHSYCAALPRRRNLRWQGRAAVYRRDVGDGEHAEIVIGERVYRVRSKELG